jgi:carbamoyltransferase
LGNALFIWHQLLGRPREPGGRDAQQGSFLGPGFTDDEARQALDARGAVYDTCASDEELCDRVADLIAAGKVVGWVQGRMEFGPRALGARSILGDARNRSMQSVMNLKVKFRESFRPFAPIVLREHVHEYFDMRPNEDSGYMLLVAPVRESLRLEMGPEYERATGIEKLHHPRSTLPAVTHIDYSARVQTVDAERHPLLHRLMSRFFEKTGCPVMINTSYNVRSEPIVCSPDDAYRCFLMTDMDGLAVGRQLVLKERQTRQVSDAERAEHLARFQLD